MATTTSPLSWSLLIIALILALVTFQPAVVAFVNNNEVTSTVKLTNFKYNTVCPTHPTTEDPAATISFTIEALQLQSFGFKRPVLSYDVTQPDVTTLDSPFRLQCTLNGQQLTNPWLNHHQIALTTATPNGVAVSVHHYTEIPEKLIPRRVGIAFAPINVSCTVYTSPNQAKMAGFITVVDMGDVKARDYSFACGLYQQIENGSADCLSLQQSTTTQVVTHAQKQRQYRRQQVDGGYFTQPLDVIKSIGLDNIDDDEFMSISQEHLSPTTTKPCKYAQDTTLQTGKPYPITNLQITSLLGIGDYWVGNATFTVSGQQPDNGKQLYLAVSYDTSTLHHNNNHMECYINHLHKVDFTGRRGSYWYSPLKSTFLPSFNVFCRYNTTYPSSRFYFSVVEEDVSLDLCRDKFQCNEANPHTDAPNPDGQCVHVVYK